MDQGGATETTNDEPASDMKQEGATGENPNAQCSEINNPTNTNDPVGQEETTETNNTAEPMEQSPSESSQQGRSGEVQGVDQTINDEPTSDMKQEGATGENPNAQSSEINNPTNTNDPVGQEETTETNPQSPETDNKAEPMEQSPSESSQQGRSGEVQGVDQTTNDQAPLEEDYVVVNDEEIKSLPESNLMNVNQATINQAALDMKQEGATDENTHQQSTETEKTNEPMEQSPSESSEQGRIGEVQSVDLTWKKFFVHLAGKTNNAHQDFVKEFKRINHTEVDSPERSDYILVFCPIVSRVGTDIGEALESTEKNNPGGKPIILVVMHHTFDPDRVIAESRRLVKNQNVKLTVDCLIYEGKLLKCHRNDTAWSEVQKIFGVSEVNTMFNSFPSLAVEVTRPSWLKLPAVPSFSSIRDKVSSWKFSATSQRNDQPAPAMVPTVLRKKLYVHLAGKTNNAHRDFVANLKRIGHTEVDSPESSDYILVFCPIVSRVGTDIGEALESSEKNNPGGKPIILVVMHHTFDPDRVIAESRRLVKNPNVHRTVDCLIYEGELLKCHRNDTAWSEVQKFLGVSEVSTKESPVKKNEKKTATLISHHQKN